MPRPRSDGVQILGPALAEQSHTAGFIGCLEHQAAAEQTNPLLEPGVVHTSRRGQDVDPNTWPVAGNEIEQRPLYDQLGHFVDYQQQVGAVTLSVLQPPLQLMAQLLEDADNSGLVSRVHESGSLVR